jgi:F-type H+-transporting ATPase subunit delta
MKVNRAAIRYSKASLDYAVDKNIANIIDKDFKDILLTVSDSNDLRDFLSNPVLPSQLKLKTLIDIFPSINNETKSIISLLSNNRRLHLLPAVAKHFIISYQKLQGKITAVVTSAIALDEPIIKQVLDKAKQMTSFQVQLNNEIDPSIIGGFILNVGDLQINASIANQLKILNNSLTNTNTSLK